MPIVKVNSMCDMTISYRKKKTTGKPKQHARTRCEVYSRIVGYLRPVNQWNDGKKEEFKNRAYLDVSKLTE